jgi:(2Fe-2S) ferredoxin
MTATLEHRLRALEHQGRQSGLASPVDRDIYLVRCFHNGEFYFPERGQKDTHLEETIADILAGQIEHVDRVFCFNPNEAWAKDVTADVAEAIANLAQKEGRRISHEVLTFIHEHAERGFALADGLEVA